MRVSEKMLFDFSKDRISRHAAAVLQGQERVSSGLRVARASEDPVAAARILRFQKTVEQVNQRLRNTNEAERFLSISETVFSDVEGVLHQASELAIDLSSGAKTALDRKNGAQVAKQLFDQMTELANTAHEGRFLFAGNKVNTRPFDFETEWKGEFIGQTLSPDGVEIIPATLPPDPNLPSNEILNVTVDGINVQVALEPGVYDGESLAIEIQDKLNNHPDLINAGKSVAVQFVFDDPEDLTSPGHLVMTSDTVGPPSSVVAHAPVGFLIGDGINDFMTVPIKGNQTSVTLTSGIYKDGPALAAELQKQLTTEAGLPVNVQFDTDHFLITPEGSASFVQALPDTLAIGDARSALGFLEGKSQISKEAYKGDDGIVSVFVEPDKPFPKNFPGSVIFKGGTEDASGVDIFASLLNFKMALENNDRVGIQTAVTDMHKALEQISTGRAEVGAGLHRIEAARAVMESVKISTASFQSDEADIDLAQAISELVQRQNALEAARSAAARILTAPTLLSFLR